MQEVINEEWRSISGYSSYQVSNIGRVRNTRGRIMALTKDYEGCLHLNLSLNGKQTPHKVHRLVAREFIPNPMNKPSVDHIDSKDKHNNTIGNLRWATQKEQRRNTSTTLNTSSNYKGVYWGKSVCRWCSRIYIDDKRIHLGYFKSEEEAALTYNKQALETFGEFANPNVIEHTQTKGVRIRIFTIFRKLQNFRSKYLHPFTA